MPRDEVEELVISNLIARKIVNIAVIRSITRIRLHKLDLSDFTNFSDSQPLSNTIQSLPYRSIPETHNNVLIRNGMMEKNPEMEQNNQNRQLKLEDINLPIKYNTSMPPRRNLEMKPPLRRITFSSQLSRFIDTENGRFWPTGRQLNLKVGKQRIEELIEKWNYPRSLSYSVEIIGLFVLRSISRFKYRVRWQKNALVSYVYFNFDAKRNDLDATAKLSYVFHNEKTVHTPRSSHYHIGWLLQLDQFGTSLSNAH